MSVVSMRELLEAGVHFGHQTRRWNPKMRRYIFTERGGIYIIDLQQTLALLEQAHAFVRNIAERGGSVLFVGTKKQAQDAVRDEAKRVRHALRQPPLARRTAHELAHDLRAHRAAPRAAPPPRRRPARAAAVEGADRDARRAREARDEPRRRRRHEAAPRRDLPHRPAQGAAGRPRGAPPRHPGHRARRHELRPRRRRLRHPGE